MVKNAWRSEQHNFDYGKPGCFFFPFIFFVYTDGGEKNCAHIASIYFWLVPYFISSM